MAVVNALKIILKNSYAIYLKTKNATRAHPAPTSGTFTCFSLCHSQHRHAHDAWYPGLIIFPYNLFVFCAPRKTRGFNWTDEPSRVVFT